MPRKFISKGIHQTDCTSLEEAFNYRVETKRCIRAACNRFGVKVMILQAFMEWHQELTLKSPEGLSIARAIAFNRTSVKAFFDAYTSAMEKYSFTPDSIFNLVESSLSAIMKPMKVVCEKGQPVASQISRELLWGL
ncbi:hypothetical protein O3P69_017999 [Scylla paramamosain]|uniref:Uncharacterized protein n=1 Tax=Scylla paramamosain TaxID=85552 RepID=A0AAW0TI47_SCYPA